MKKLILGIALAAMALTVHGRATARTELVGHVISPPGKSVKATAVLCYWQTKPGRQLSDMRDLPRHVQADEEGNFKFLSLDPSLLYQVLIFAPGWRLQSIKSVDPTTGPLNVRLEPAIPTNAPRETVVRGRLKDARGNPVSGALIRILGVTRNGRMTSPAYEIDFYSVSDDAGSFVVYGETPFTAVEGAVEAPGFSKALFEGWQPGDTVHELTLIEGAAFKGRLLQAGKAVANAEILIQNFGAESGSSVWHYFAFTDSEGRFAFTHLPPNRSFSLYATMESLAGQGAVSKQRGEVRENGSTTDFGDLNLDPAFTVEGRIRLSDGKPIPAESRIRLNRRTMVGYGDGLSFMLGEDGSFHFAGVPAEPVTLYLRIPGYQFTPRDALLKFGSATNITVVANVTGLVIEMKPAARR